MTLSEIESDSDGYHCFDPSWNPNCMTILDWVKVQAEDQVIHDLIQWYGTKELHKGSRYGQSRNEAVSLAKR